LMVRQLRSSTNIEIKTEAIISTGCYPRSLKSNLYRVWQNASMTSSSTALQQRPGYQIKLGCFEITSESQYASSLTHQLLSFNRSVCGFVRFVARMEPT
jgi:hypothetical protein